MGANLRGHNSRELYRRETRPWIGTVISNRVHLTDRLGEKSSSSSSSVPVEYPFRRADETLCKHAANSNKRAAQVPPAAVWREATGAADWAPEAKGARPSPTSPTDAAAAGVLIDMYLLRRAASAAAGAPV